MLAYIKEDN